jgi:predicted permease
MRDPDDFREEIRAHVELEADRLRQQGLSAEEARAAARRSFGNLTGAEERYYESRRWTWLDLLAQNVRFGLRMLARNPGSSAIAILTLALGIGANTAIFSLLDAVVFRNLPVHQPEQLVLFGKGEWAGSADDVPNRSWQLFSYPGYREFQRKNQVFSDVAAIDSILFTTHGRVASGENLEKVAVELVSGTFFHTLGVNAALGRTLTDADDAAPGAHPVAVANYSWWQRRLGKAPSVLGTRVTIGSTDYSIIGVTPPEFFGAIVGQSPDLWIPLAMEKEVSPGWNGLDKDLFQSLYVFARRKPGVTIQQAGANVNVLFQQMVQAYAGPQPSRKQLESISHARVEVTPAATGLSHVRQRLTAPLAILMAVVALVLLIACANVANLLLARSASRQREIAVRMSIGAGRSRLIQQLLIESGLLGLAGAVLSVPIAWGLLRLLVSMGSEPLALRVAPDMQVLGFALALTMLTVLLFGTVPAFRATRLELAPSLRAGRGVMGGSSRSRLARGLIVGQVALSLALLTGAGLLLHSLINLMNVNTGFDRRNVLLAGIDPAGAGYREDARLETMMERLEDRVARLPGIQGAGFALSVFNGGGRTGPVTVPGQPALERDVTHNIVGARYLEAMNMPIVLGRSLSSRDDEASQRVAVINETMARTYFPGISPLGRTFSTGDEPEWQDIAVVGVVRDAKYMELQEKQQAAAFYPHAQHHTMVYNFVVRYTGDRKVAIREVRRAVAEVDPNLPIDDFSTLARVVNDSVGNSRLVAQLSTAFGALAALLASIGIYGVMSYGISRRTNEFGIRMALGAQRSDVLWMVLRETLALVLTGVAAGLALALALSRLETSMLFGLTPADPVAIGLATALMMAVALFAGWLPARRATRIDPTVALRYE